MLQHIIVSLIFFISVLKAGAQEQKVYRQYYPGGKIKSITHEGIFNGCNMPVGTDSLFYSSGELMLTKNYNNIKSKNGGGCHDGWTIATTTTYFKSGGLKTSSQQKYSYEGAPCDCSVWLKQNSQGTVTEKKQLNNCFDQVPCESKKQEYQ